MSTVSLLAVKEYQPEILDSAVEEHFRLLGLDRVLKGKRRVVLKPNLLMKRTPGEATTTHPELVGAVARALKRRGVTDIVLADSPGGPYTPALLSAIYQATGMAEAAKREGVRLNMDVGWRTVATGRPGVAQFNLITPVADADLVINLCKLKTHCMTGLSGAVKNLFGCVPGLQKPEFHYRFKQPDSFCGMLVDLCETVRPAITFVDAVVSMEGDGPSSGHPVHTGLTLAATDPYALDVVLAKLIHMPPEQALTVKAAALRGLASQLDSIELAGDPGLLQSLERFRLPSTKPVDFNRRLPRCMQGAADWLTDRWLVPRPVVHRRTCTGCGRCAQSCPAKTIAIEGGKARISYGQCIKCYCCHEMCPVKAISVHHSALLHGH